MKICPRADWALEAIWISLYASQEMSYTTSKRSVEFWERFGKTLIRWFWYRNKIFCHRDKSILGSYQNSKKSNEPNILKMTQERFRSLPNQPHGIPWYLSGQAYAHLVKLGIHKFCHDTETNLVSGQNSFVIETKPVKTNLARWCRRLFGLLRRLLETSWKRPKAFWT